ncbi:MAG TPA: hypothetical protein VNT20_13370 [Flavisolibacter sp.]|jgi:hypothetical protein|nr:hypothetical protein [Flavisolibacter sp.]
MKPKGLSRNQPTEEGRNNDPNLRDESAAQPGINTVSNSDYDEDNEKLTKTAADDFRTKDDSDSHADPSFDEVDYD